MNSTRLFCIGCLQSERTVFKHNSKINSSPYEINCYVHQQQVLKMFLRNKPHACWHKRVSLHKRVQKCAGSNFKVFAIPYWLSNFRKACGFVDLNGLKKIAKMKMGWEAECELLLTSVCYLSDLPILHERFLQSFYKCDNQ